MPSLRLLSNLVMFVTLRSILKSSPKENLTESIALIKCMSLVLTEENSFYSTYLLYNACRIILKRQAYSLY